MKTPELSMPTPGGMFMRHLLRGDLTPESGKTIWQRFPELKKIPEDKWPKNVFIIPDGNGRWAALNNLAVQQGHEKGAQAIVNIFNDLSELSDHIPFVGAWGLSVDNFKRPPEEVDFLMKIFNSTIEKLEPDLIKRGDRFIHIGRKDIFDNHQQLAQTIKRVEEETMNNKGQTVYIAIGFGGEDQETRIAQKAAELKIANPNIKITNELLRSLRDGNGRITSPDLVIRTSGEQRLSDLGWIAGKAELFFDKTLFPAYGTQNAVNAICDFSERDRRFGGRPLEQVVFKA